MCIGGDGGLGKAHYNKQQEDIVIHFSKHCLKVCWQGKAFQFAVFKKGEP